jgi:aminopeptidase-like protein
MSKSFIKHTVLVRDVLPKEIIQKANQYETIENTPEFNLRTKNGLIQFLLYVTYYKYKNENATVFLNLIDQNNSILDIQQVFNSMDFNQLLEIKDSFN